MTNFGAETECNLLEKTICECIMNWNVVKDMDVE